jgi:hypothetical protein
MHARGPDCGTAIGDRHLYGCGREACPHDGGVLMACGCLWQFLPEAVQMRCGGEVCFVPAAVWGPVLQGKRQPSPWPPRRA